MLNFVFYYHPNPLCLNIIIIKKIFLQSREEVKNNYEQKKKEKILFRLKQNFVIFNYC